MNTAKLGIFAFAFVYIYRVPTEVHKFKAHPNSLFLGKLYKANLEGEVEVFQVWASKIIGC